MSTHTAVRTQLDISPVGDLVDSLAERASSAIGSFDVVKVDLQRTPPQAANDSPSPSPWFQPLPTQPKSPLGKSGAFALVAAAHVLVFFGIANLPQSVRERITVPLQVVSIVEEQVTQDLPPPPKPQVQNFDVPVEPIVLDIADPDSMAITVRAQPQEAVAAPQTPTAAAPKMVSSVEYVREPAAKYPAAARALKQRGIVTLRVLVDASGRAREVTVHKSSGHKLLDDAGRKAVLDGVYKPYTENGHALPVYVLIPIEFSVA
jgi:protein TonB